MTLKKQVAKSKREQGEILALFFRQKSVKNNQNRYEQSQTKYLILKLKK